MKGTVDEEQQSSLRQRPSRRQSVQEGAASDGIPQSSGSFDDPKALHNLLYRYVVIAASIYGLYELEFFPRVLYGSKVDHGWFKVGLACSVALLAMKAYVEMFQGKAKKKRVDYDNFRNETHAILALLLIASFSFHISLWPQYHLRTFLLVDVIIGYGLLLQICLITPTWLQNFASAVLMTWFLQSYV